MKKNAFRKSLENSNCLIHFNVKINHKRNIKGMTIHTSAFNGSCSLKMSI